MSKSRNEIDRLKQPGEHDQINTPTLSDDPERESADKELLTEERRNKLDTAKSRQPLSK
jgi:hypothetical protein